MRQFKSLASPRSQTGDSQMMDEGRKRTLWICASILAAPKLAEFKDGEKDALQVDIVRDAVQKAERIIGHIDCRWPSNRVAGSRGPGMDV